MELKKVKLNELADFCTGEQFQQFSVKPISPLRMKSYLANPRAKEEDVVLYLLIENKELIAFRTILPDTLLYENGKYLRFGWCSGVWVDPKHRGKQLWKPLLTEAMADWNNQLMFTNYSHKNRDNYIRSGSFSLSQLRSGYRFYMYPNFKEILARRASWPLNTLASPVSWIANFFMKTKKLLLKKQTPAACYIELDLPDEDCKRLLMEQIPHTLFQRGMTEFEWIVNNPWVTDLREKDFHYPFSYDGISYRIKSVKCFLGQDMIGFFIYSLVNRKMKVLYYYEVQKYAGAIALPIVELAQQNRINHLTVQSSLLSKNISKLPWSFIHQKPFESNIYSSFPLQINGKRIFDGDGDNSFT